MRLLAPVAIAALALVPRLAAGQRVAEASVAVAAVILPSAPELDVRPLAAGVSAHGLRWRLDGSASRNVVATLDRPLPAGISLVTERRGASGSLTLHVAPTAAPGEVTRTVTLVVTSMN